VTRYDRRVDRIACELLEPSVDRNREPIPPDVEAKLHLMMDLIAGVMREADREGLMRSGRFTGELYGGRNRKARLRVVS
jgi:hypothetical protein